MWWANPYWIRSVSRFRNVSFASRLAAFTLCTVRAIFFGIVRRKPPHLPYHIDVSTLIILKIKKVDSWRGVEFSKIDTVATNHIQDCPFCGELHRQAECVRPIDAARQQRHSDSTRPGCRYPRGDLRGDTK